MKNILLQTSVHANEAIRNRDPTGVV